MSRTEDAAAVRPFGARDKIGYALGDCGNDFTFMLSSVILLKFYTDVMGVSAGLVSAMMMGCKFVDAVTDVTMGQIVDRSEPTAKGKFIPWMRRFMGPVAVASFLLYATWFKDMSTGFKIGWMFVTYILWGSVCYTGVNIPYGSMASALTDDPHQRTLLSTYRNMGATLANMSVSVILPLVVYYYDANGNQVLSGTKVTIAAAVCSVLALLCYMLSTSMCTERVRIEKKTEKFSLSELGKQLFTSRSTLSIIVIALVLLLSMMTMTTMAGYVFPNYFNNASGQSIASLCGTLLSFFLALVVIPPATKKIGKKELAIIGNIIAAIAYFILFFIHTTNMTVYIIGFLLGYFGIGCFNGVIWAMIVDVIDADEVERGTRSDGTIYSLYSFARKLGQALASGLAGVILTVVGYTTETAFDKSVTDGIYNGSTLIPAIGFLLVFILLIVWYPLDKKTVDKNAAELARRRTEK